MRAPKAYLLPLLSLVAFGTVLAGCGEPTDRPSEITTLRVLAVRSDAPFVAPGDNATLHMLAHDGSPLAKRKNGEPRQTSTIWIAGCSNPPGDSYQACAPFLTEVVRRLGNDHLKNQTIPDGSPQGIVGFGEDFETTVPSNIISSRKRAPGVVHPYGVEFVFFAHCGGVLKRTTDGDKHFPLGCFDADTGKELGRDDFEYGFYALYAYESLRNQNPELSSITFNDTAVGTTCSTTEPCTKGFHCGSESRCIPVVPRCTKSEEDDCKGYTVSVSVPKSSVERSITAHVTESVAKNESQWISYYAAEGSFEEGARTVNDPNSGWRKDISGKWRASTKNKGEVRLFAVARDDRNGVSWAWTDVWVE